MSEICIVSVVVFFFIAKSSVIAEYTLPVPVVSTLVISICFKEKHCYGLCYNFGNNFLCNFGFADPFCCHLCYQW